MRRTVFDVTVSRAAMWSRRLALFALTLAGLAVMLARSRALDPFGALAVLGVAEAIALVALGLAALAGVAIWRLGLKGAGAAFLGFIVSAGTLAPLAYAAGLAVALPAVNDLATDLDTPPPFVSSSKAFAARGGPAPGPMSVAAIAAEKEFYPNFKPILVKTDADAAFAAALQAVKNLGWRVADALPPGDRGGGQAEIDALDASPILHFQDEIVLRLRPLEGATIIDMRSASGLGRHDFGANAKRIAAFAAAIKETAPTR